jgi:hypothetical protein
LLYKQVELTELEAQLDQLDKEDNGTEGQPAENRWRVQHSLALHDGAMNEKRKELVEKIEEKMEIYG